MVLGRRRRHHVSKMLGCRPVFLVTLGVALVLTGCDAAHRAVRKTSSPAQNQRASGRCSQAAVTVALTQPISPMTGEHGRVFILSNRSGKACLLNGFPRIAFYARGHRLPFVQRDGRGAYVTHRPPQPVLLGVGARVYFLAAKYRCDGQVAAEASQIRVSLPGGWGTARRAPLPGESVSAFDYCRRYPGDSQIDPGNYVWVSPIVASPAAIGP
jgi:hypothetical protein